MVLVSIIGDFYSSVLPVFYEFKESITKHIIIYDNFKNDTIAANKIINGTRNFNKRHNLNIQTIPRKIDEDSYRAINEAIKYVANEVNDPKELYINITDGLANIGLFFSEFFLPKGAKVLTYDRFDNEYNLLSSSTMHKYTIKNSMPIKEHLMLKDIEILSMQDTRFAHENEEKIAKYFERYEGDGKMYAQEFGTNDELLNRRSGELYEYYIYNLVRRLNVDDIAVGVKIKDRYGMLDFENELDIIIQKNNHMHTIECKYIKNFSPTSAHAREQGVGDILYKLDSVRQSLDEDANVFIVTNSEHYDDSSQPVKELNTLHKRSLVKKVFLRGSPVAHTRQFIKDVDRLFGLDTPNIEEVIKQRPPFESVFKAERERMKNEINEFLSRELDTYTNDFFKKEVTEQLLTYETNSKLSSRVRRGMEQQDVYEVVKLIQRHLTARKSPISIEDVYEHYLRSQQ